MKTLWLSVTVAAVVIGNPAGLAMMKAELGGLPEFVWAQFSIYQLAPLLGGFSLYLATFFLWVMLIGLSPLTIIQPIGLGLMMIVTTVISYWKLDEQLSPVQLLGTAIIVAGVTLLASNGRRGKAAAGAEQNL